MAATKKPTTNSVEFYPKDAISMPQDNESTWLSQQNYLKMIQATEGTTHLIFTLELLPKGKNKQNLQILFLSHSGQIC